jgi:hypothetical protein
MAFLDAISHRLAMAEAERAVSQPETADETAMLDRVESRARIHIRDLRRQIFEELRNIERGPERQGIPARILAMTRDAVAARLRDLELAAPGGFQVAYRKLDELTLHELQVMLTDVEDALAEAGE